MSTLPSGAGLVPALSMCGVSTRPHPHRGYTLPELLITVAIVGVLTALSAPTLHDWQQRRAQTALFEQLSGAAAFARTRAIRDRHYLTLCPSTDRVHCGDRWQASIIVFSDDNHNEAVDGDDRLYRTFTLPDSAPCIEWHGGARRNYLQFNPLGASNGTAGHFRRCHTPADETPRLVVSLSGRTSLRHP